MAKDWYKVEFLIGAEPGERIEWNDVGERLRRAVGEVRVVHDLVIDNLSVLREETAMLGAPGIDVRGFDR